MRRSEPVPLPVLEVTRRLLRFRSLLSTLVVRELKHEIEAYTDFCTFRRDEEKRRRKLGKDDQVTRDEWLDSRRVQLHSRMRRRRRGDKQRGKNRSPFSLF